jgi:Lrp/AsnC family transcriptional regulator, regulator for asnA, asnC and gidA
MDRIDRDILRLMRKKSDMPFLQIAEKIGVSSITVQARYEKMKKDGVFFGTTLMLDLSKIGFHGKAFLFITISKDCDVRKIVESFRQMPNLFFVVEVVGAFDLLAMIVFRDVAEIIKIVNDIKLVPCVEKVEVALSNESFYPLRKEYTEIDLFEPEKAEI